MSERPTFEALYAENAAQVFRLALRLSGNREDAEDLVAETLAEAFRSCDKYDGKSRPGTWLCAITLNRWRMHRRKRKVPQDSLHTAEDVSTSFRFQDLELAEALAGLPEALREAFLLVKGEGLSHAEAARALRVPVGTVYFRVHRAVHRLRAELDPNPRVTRATNEVTCETDL